MRRIFVILLWIFVKALGSNAGKELKFENQPALGRIVQLGSLYYAADTRLAFDETLWRVENIRANATKENRTSSVARIVYTNSKRDKFEVFDVSAELTLSALYGMVAITGSAGYFRDDKTGSQKANLALTYESTVSVEYINQDMRSSLDFPDVCENMHDRTNPATHVVSSIIRGFVGTFNFDIDTSNFRTNTTLNAGKLRIEILEGTLSGETSLKFMTGQEDVQNSTFCTFYGDTVLKSAPTSVEEAKQAFKNLSRQAQTSRAITQFTLSPISKYCGGQGTVIINEISKKMTEQLNDIVLEMELTREEIRALFLIESANMYWREIELHVTRFSNFFEQFEAEWKRNLTIILPQVRRNELPRERLAEHITDYLKSPFNHVAASLFIDNRVREMRTVDIVIKDKEKYEGGIIFEKASIGKGNVCLFRHPCTFMYVLKVFPANDLATKYKDDHSKNKYSEGRRWFWNEMGVARAGARFHDLVDYYELNKQDKICCFIVNLQRENPNPSSNIAEITLFKAGFKQFQDVRLPTVITVPEKYNVYHNKIEFDMFYSRDDISKDIVVEYYDYVIKDDVDGRRLVKNKTWILDYQINDSTVTYPVKLENLKPNTQYTITIRTRSEYGKGPKTEKKIITNPVAPAAYLRLEKKTIHAVQMAWRKPEMDGRKTHSGDIPKYEISVCEGSEQELDIDCTRENAVHSVPVQAKPYKVVVYYYPEENVTTINIEAKASATNQTTNQTEDWYSHYQIDLELEKIKEMQGEGYKEKNIFNKTDISRDDDLDNRTHPLPSLNDFEVQLVPDHQNKSFDPTYCYRLSWTMNVTDDTPFNTHVFSNIQYVLNNVTFHARDYRVFLGNLSHAQKYVVSVKPNWKDRDEFADADDIKRKDLASNLSVATRPPKIRGVKWWNYCCDDHDEFDKRNDTNGTIPSCNEFSPDEDTLKQLLEGRTNSGNTSLCRHGVQIHMRIDVIRDGSNLDYLDYINVRHCELEAGDACGEWQKPMTRRLTAGELDKGYVTLQVNDLEAESRYLVQVKMDTSFKSFLDYGEGDYSNPIEVRTGPKGREFNDILADTLGVKNLTRNKDNLLGDVKDKRQKLEGEFIKNIDALRKFRQKLEDDMDLVFLKACAEGDCPPDPP